MLKHIQLTNFQRHRALSIGFSPGLTAITAANEFGKSSLLRAIAYALFGTKALSEPLDAIVTWGEPVNSLKVELTFEVAGTTYTITRTKGSAELRYGDESVTGQHETAKFVADLLGADAALAANLIIAGQNDIRGALAGGSKSAIALIEKLADFDQLDRLIDLLQSHLTLGSTAPAKAALEQAQAVLGGAEEPAPLDRAALDAEVQALAARSSTLGAEAEAVNEAAAAAAKARDKALAATQRQRDLEVKIEDRTGALERLRGEEPALAPWDDVSDGALRAAERDVQELEASVQRMQERQRGEALNEQIAAARGEAGSPDSDRFDGPESAATEAHREAVERGRDASAAASEYRQQAAVKRALIQAEACTLCGRDVSQIPEVVAKNAALEDEACKLDVASEEAQDAFQQWSAYAESLARALADHQRLKAFRQASWTIDNARTPGVLVWAGGRADEGDAYRLLGAKDTLKALRQSEEAHAESVRARNAHRQRVERAQAELQALIDEQAGMPPAPDLEALRAAVAEAEGRRQSAASAYTAALQAHSARSVEVVRLVGEYEKLAGARERAQAEVATRTAELQALEFNNALLKAVREARPVVANKLWALVLGAVSEFFSAMRGQPSVVTRGADGFMVDGHAVATLSGSTKDILGLAIRIALTRTFLPGISLLMLDEPNAAMDDERTANVLGFLGGAGFNQIIVVSHDEMTVDVADHVVTLEA